MDMKFFKTFALVVALFIVPSFAKADIIISEIAWMGTTVSANYEWIELQNTGSSSVNLSGWTLRAEDGTPSINLSGQISGNSYQLLERPDSAVPGISALVVFTGALGNTGEHLVLRDGNGGVIQNLNFSSGWVAGDNTTKKTMQWNGSSWITADATPGADNAEFDSGTSGNQNTDGTENENTTDEDDEEEVVATSGSSNKDETIIYENRILKIDAPTRAIVETPTKFSAQAYDFNRSSMFKGRYVWNMGDGTIREYNHKTKKDYDVSFSHTYKYPGTYVVTVDYFVTYFDEIEPDVTETFNVEVVASGINISKVLFDGSIELKNSGSFTFDLSDWVLRDSFGREFAIPKGTKILSGKTITLTKDRTKLNPLVSVSLLTPNKSPTSFYSNQKVASTSTSNSSVKTQKVSLEKENENISGEILGVENDNDNMKTKRSNSNGLVWILLFIILILVAVVAILILQKGKEREEYKLIDE
ncbi:MAG: lamin tail domain-containing protein [Bacteroidetes bacterium]|nr:lamin tail domain-containing protein [Bacteroidota bacterium]